MIAGFRASWRSVDEHLTKVTDDPAVKSRVPAEEPAETRRVVLPDALCDRLPEQSGVVADDGVAGAGCARLTEPCRRNQRYCLDHLARAGRAAGITSLPVGRSPTFTACISR